MNLPPLSLYVHVPWCVRKCPYCDFNSHALRAELPEQAYIDALLADLAHALATLTVRPLSSVFLGGGTPSLLHADAIARLLEGVNALLPLRGECEITLEANPGTLEQGRFADYRAAGINRLSLGIQSFDDAALARLGRAHDAHQARRAIAAARAAGFDNLNLDLMYALPGQDEAAALADLDEACAAAPAHISWYQLTLEPNTLFHRYPPALPDDDTVWRMEQAAHARLAESGYARYEVSAFAAPGRQCTHNLNYWRFGDYLGIGAGAHSKLTRSLPGEVERASRQRQPRAYLDAAGNPPCIVSQRRLDEADLVLEFALNALRLRKGFTAGLFTGHTGLPYARIGAHIARLCTRGLLEVHGEHIRATPRGYRFLDDTVAGFADA